MNSSNNRQMFAMRIYCFEKNNVMIPLVHMLIFILICSSSIYHGLKIHGQTLEKSSESSALCCCQMNFSLGNYYRRSLQSPLTEQAPSISKPRPIPGKEAKCQNMWRTSGIKGWNGSSSAQRHLPQTVGQIWWNLQQWKELQPVTQQQQGNRDTSPHWPIKKPFSTCIWFLLVTSTFEIW